ncbi:MAG: PEP-CTERM sorting domain-containing protein, partial [Candidatus Omnitrophica bacterium]|nr:PEP-CTERM sorting domain-containing protein [Candidatus Omnitrophota bacterium]
DAAPNVYGSPDYPGWQSATFAAVANETFVNMSNGVNPANVGTTDFEIQDEVVYSFGDLGLRLTWIYWIPNTTIAELTGKFQISLFNDWDGDVQDFYLDYYSSTWLQPSSWVEYAGGVIGTAGMAWWGAYNTNTQAELDADIAEWGLANESWTFTARLLDGGAVVCEKSIVSNREGVPEPATMALVGSGLAALAARRKRLV